MRRNILVVFDIVLIVLFTACQKTNVDSETEEKYVEKGKEVVEALLDLDYETVYEQFNGQMQRELPVEDMHELTPVIEDAGEFEKIETTAIEERDGIYVTDIVTKHEERKLGFTVSFEENGEVAGVYIK